MEKEPVGKVTPGKQTVHLINKVEKISEVMARDKYVARACKFIKDPRKKKLIGLDKYRPGDEEQDEEPQHFSRDTMVCTGFI